MIYRIHIYNTRTYLNYNQYEELYVKYVRYIITHKIKVVVIDKEDYANLVVLNEVPITLKIKITNEIFSLLIAVKVISMKNK